jgi:hypothetical protein
LSIDVPIRTSDTAVTPSGKDYFEAANGDIQLSIHDGASIHLRSVTKHGDPVELSSEEARSLAKLLIELAERAN